MKHSGYITWTLLCTVAAAYSHENTYHTYFWALYNQFEQNHTQAAQSYHTLLQHPQPCAIYESFARHLLQTGQYSHLEQVLPVLEASPQKKLDTEILCIHILEALGKRELAEQKIVAVHAQHPHHPELTYYAATIEIQRNNYQQALAILDTYLQNAQGHHHNFLMHFLKAHIFCAQQDIQQALHEVQKSIALHPHFDQGWLLAGLLYESLGNIDHAIQGYQTCLSLIGKNSFVEQQLQHLHTKQAAIHKTAQALFHQALQHVSQNNYELALQKVNESLQLAVTVPSRLLKIEIITKLHQETAALQHLEHWLLEDPEQHVFYQILHIFLDLNVPAQTILTLLQNIEKQHPATLYPLLYQADIYVRTADKTHAHQYLQKTLPQLSDPFLRTTVLFQLGLLYYEEQKYDLMYQYLQEARLLGTQFAPVLNLLAYYYTTIAVDLDQAQQLIQAALEHDRNNPHFLDTQALIWYKQKKYTQAYTLLTSLCTAVTDDPTIYYHCAQCAYKLGQREEAHQLLAQAIKNTSKEQEKKQFERRLQKMTK